MSDIDSVIKYVDDVVDMIENLNTASCEKAINTLCTRIEKTVDFDQIEKYKAGELLDSLRVLVSNIGNKIPANVSQRVTDIQERLEVRATQTPGKSL
jgi:hypothetical protein